MKPSQRQAVKAILSIADAQGLMARWAPGTGMLVDFREEIDLVATVVALQELEAEESGLVSVIEVDPVVRRESTAPYVTVRLGARIRQMASEGYFDEA